MNSKGFIVNGDGRIEETSSIQACEAWGHAPFVWIHLDARASDSRQWLEKHSGLSETMVSALLAEETRPRADIVAPGLIVNLRGLGIQSEQTGDPLVSIRVWAEEGRAISVSFRRLDGIESLEEMMRAGEIRDPGDLISEMAVCITSRLDPVVAGLGDAVDLLESRLDERNPRRARRHIAEARLHAIQYRRFVAPQRAALERLAAANVDWLSAEDRGHLREAADRAARMAEELESVRERSALLHEQLTDLRTEQIDQRSLVVATIALIFLPLTFVTGLFGMNVPGIPWKDHPQAFLLIALGCAIAGLVLWTLVRIRRWV